MLMTMAARDPEEPVQPGVEPKGGPDALRPFIGRWVALDDERAIRASGDTFPEVLAEADRVQLKDPEFLFVQPVPRM